MMPTFCTRICSLPWPVVCYTASCWGLHPNPQHEGRETMPKSLAHRLVWSEAHQQYQHLVHGQPEQCFRSGDEPAFSYWLSKHTAFAFVGQAGRLSIIQE